jgi:hypothetical protein
MRDLLHHIHTVVRCFCNPTIIEAPSSYPVVRKGAPPDEFDFGDLHIAQTMMLRLGRAAIFVVFNDSTGALSFYQENMLDKITGPISELQAREVMTEFAMLNLHLKERPICPTSSKAWMKKSASNGAWIHLLSWLVPKTANSRWSKTKKLPRGSRDLG